MSGEQMKRLDFGVFIRRLCGLGVNSGQSLSTDRASWHISALGAGDFSWL